MGRTEDLSLGGGMLRMDDAASDMTVDEEVVLNFEQIEGNGAVPARLVAVNGLDVRVEFKPTSLDDERTIVSAVFGRADAWLNWADRPPDTVGKSLADLMGAIRSLGGMARRRLTAVSPSRGRALRAVPGSARPT